MSLRILIFSDNGSFTEYLRQLLTSAGHEPLPPLDGAESHRVLRKENPDLIIVAVDGAGAVHLAKQRLQTAKGVRTAPLIVISDDPAVEADLHHVFDFIPKPLDAGRLLDAVAAVAKRAAHHAAPAEALSDDEYRELSRHILARTGLHFESRKRSSLERAVRKRMTPLLLENCGEYLAFLKRHGESRNELQKLVQLLTVGETYFFRYPAHYRALTATLTRQARSGNAPIRIWSAGCSTGEEPYTIAMAVMDAFPDWKSRDIRIIATDINHNSIRQARRALYTPWSLRSTEPAHRERYFERSGEGFLLREEVKSLVAFHQMNLAEPGASEVCRELREFDAVFCRNVLIYFSPDKAVEMLDTFAAALKPGGLLFLGHAEAMFQRPAELEVGRQENSFFYRKKGVTPASAQEEMPPASQRAPLPPPPSPPPSTPPSAPPESGDDAAARLKVARDLFDAEQFDAALAAVEALLAGTPDDPAPLILKGFILASRGRIAEALETCCRVIEINDLLPDAYFLKGVLLDACDFLDQAADEYRKALLLDHDFIMPRYYMGRLHLRLGRVPEGTREIRNSIRLLARQGEEGTVPYSGGLTRSLCLAQLQSALARVA